MYYEDGSYDGLIHPDADSDELMHYGMPRRSGRYPWGSGKDPYQHSADFLARVESLEKAGFTQKEIAEKFSDENNKMTTTQLRTQVALAKEERRSNLIASIKSMKEDGYNNSEIARKLNLPSESTVRSLLNSEAETRMNRSKVAAEYLKEAVDKKAKEDPLGHGMIDVGAGVEREIGDLSKEKMNEALYILQMQGYEVYGGGLPQVTNKGQQTNLKVLCSPGTEHKEIYQTDRVHSLKDYDQVLTDNGGNIRKRFEYPESLDSKRLMIRYAEEGGIDKDGLVELRRGPKDISLGDSHYAQVRIMVDGTHYIKGMAVYGDDKDFPPGVDVIFNTNKHQGTPALGEKDNTVLKNIKKDPNNPFGSAIKEDGGQSYYDDPKGRYFDATTGKKQSLSLINKRADEGDWGNWSDHLPSQFLAKQSEQLIKKQLNLSKADKIAEFDAIRELNNPTIKKKLLESFANDCDSASVHLQAAALPRQKYQVILPMTTIKDTEVYAPNYKNGEKVALVRYPHGGTFEIPILTVNNKNPEGQRMMSKNPKDAVGISKKVADRLSGADFDGDTVMVIPTNSKVSITSTHPLRGLEGFDPKDIYGPSSTKVPYKRMKNTQTEMGKISNLITDMTLKGATEDELARAVRHSMVVIDAEKHNLNYKQSEKDNGIAALKKKYQGRVENGKYKDGAATLISRAKSEVSVPKRQGSPIINEDGSLSYKISSNLHYEERKKVYEKDPITGRYLKDANGDKIVKRDPATGKEIWQNTGKIKTRTQKSTQMAETKDARTLVSDMRNPKEMAYADYANSMKSLANQARKEMVSTGNLKYSPTAAKTYAAEVKDLDSKLMIAQKNAPRERQAQLLANTVVNAKKQDNPGMTNEEIKKISQQALVEARLKVGAKRNPIPITDREWEAIQAGAIHENKLQQILKNTNLDELRQRATPRQTTELSSSKQAKIHAMQASGYSTSEIAEAIGCSSSTVTKYL